MPTPPKRKAKGLPDPFVAKPNKGWIGVDLDGTLAEYTTWQGIDKIGAPIAEMVERVRAWLAEGKHVRIFTARISGGGDDAKLAVRAIHTWLKAIGLPELIVTNTKDFQMIECWDDRAVQVVPNTGKRADGQPG